MTDSNGQLLLPFKQPKKRTIKVDYEDLAVWIADREVTRIDLQTYTGIKGDAIRSIIDTLSIQYTLYDVKHGVYKMARPVKRRKE